MGEIHFGTVWKQCGENEGKRARYKKISCHVWVTGLVPVGQAANDDDTGPNSSGTVL